jgi:hypothetical protein
VFRKLTLYTLKGSTISLKAEVHPGHQLTCPKHEEEEEEEINTLNAALNPICHLLALLGAHHIIDVSRIRG